MFNSDLDTLKSHINNAKNLRKSINILAGISDRIDDPNRIPVACSNICGGNCPPGCDTGCKHGCHTGCSCAKMR